MYIFVCNMYTVSLTASHLNVIPFCSMWNRSTVKVRNLLLIFKRYYECTSIVKTSFFQSLVDFIKQSICFINKIRAHWKRWTLTHDWLRFWQCLQNWIIKCTVFRDTYPLVIVIDRILWNLLQKTTEPLRVFKRKWKLTVGDWLV